MLKDDVIFSRQIADVLAQSLAELAEREWRLLSLGGHRWDQAFAKAPGCRFLQTAHGPTSLHAVAYHRSVYARILGEVPDTPTAMARWLQTHRGIDQYYAHRFDGTSVVTCPSVASQPPPLSQETPPFEPLPVTG